jgi:RNA polymerase sigma factor (TIGR02999 family)
MGDLPAGAASGGDATVQSELTAALRAVGAGDREAVGRAFDAVYLELRRLARRHLRSERRDLSLHTTGLVHEAFLRLSAGASWSAADRRHFFALAGQAMRRVLVDHARRRARGKRGGGVVMVPLDEVDAPVSQRSEELIALDRALARLESEEPELARIVELRFFAGLSVEEVAELLETSDRTIKRRWRVARALLLRDLEADGVAS